MKYEKTKFQKHDCVEIKTKSLRLLVTADVGPRIAFLGKNDRDNLLFWDTKNLGRGQWKLMGGHRIWSIRPGADESEDAYIPDNHPCDIKQDKETITFTGQPDPSLKIKKGMTIRIVKENRLTVDNFIVNAGDMLYSTGVWALTCTDFREGRLYAVPLGDNSEWDCFRLVLFRRWGGGHTSSFNDPQIKLTEDNLLFEPKGMETKRMLEAPSGIIAMNAPDQAATFIKKSEFRKNADYPMGCNIAFYVGPKNFMVEMETMGPLVTLKPGEEAHLTETWILADGAIDIKNPKNLFKAV